MALTFSNDIMPLFSQFKAQMNWRFDLTNYEHVKANAQVIYERISSSDAPMPPPPFDPLTTDQILMFERWMREGCAP
jgi:hypothetical protein